MEEIVNRLAKSPVLTFDLTEFKLEQHIVQIDLASVLYMGLVLKEKDFNEFLEQYHWDSLSNKIVSIFCSVDAILPQWAFLSVAAKAQQKAKSVVFADSLQTALQRAIEEAVELIDFEVFRNKVVVIKGCGQHHIPMGAYIRATAKLSLFSRKILFGEPCSAVPVFKKI